MYAVLDNLKLVLEQSALTIFIIVQFGFDKGDSTLGYESFKLNDQQFWIQSASQSVRQLKRIYTTLFVKNGMHLLKTRRHFLKIFAREISKVSCLKGFSTG